MRMLLILPLLLAVMSAVALAANPLARQQALLSDGAWQFVGSGDLLPDIGTAEFDKAAWEPVQLPHVFQTRAKPMDIQEGWYRSRVSVPTQDGGKRLYLRFEGAATVADVYVNGKHLGQHRGAYTAFIFDATEALHAGTDNVLAVRVDDRPASMADCLPNGSRLYKVWGGLYRKVWLIATDPLHIDPTDDASPGVYITPTNVTDQGADLSIRALVVNRSSTAEEANIRAVLLDPSDKAVQTWMGHATVSPGHRIGVELKGHVEYPHLWAPGSPNLYHVRVNLLRGEQVTDSVTEPTGFRSVVWKDGIVMWNGKHILLAGADLHQEIESKASAMSDDDFRADYALVRDLGANWMRLPHYPHAQFEYDLCDQLGIAVWAENGHTNKEAPTPNSQQITTEMVKQNYNHPCIALWSVGNEASSDTADAMVPVIHALDKTRPVFVANMKSGQCDFHAANSYPGWYGKGDGFDLAAHGYISESGAGGVVSVHCDYAAAKVKVNKYEPEEYQQRLAEQLFHHIFRDNDGKLGMYTWWALRDFNDTKYKQTKAHPGVNSKGLLTYAGAKKDVYYLYRCYLRPDVATVHITSKCYFLRMGDPANGIKAYSNAKQLTLTLNGEKTAVLTNGGYADAKGRHLDNVFYWPVPLRTGRNEVSVDDGAGNTDSAVLYFYGSGAMPEVAGTAKPPLVTDLRVSNSHNRAFYMDMPVQPQWPIYYDLDTTADNTFDQLPEPVKGSTWIALRRLTKTDEATDLNFTLTRPATVFIMSSATDTPPAFIEDAGFSPIPTPDLMWRDNDLILVPADLFSRKVPAGGKVYLPKGDRDLIVMLKE